MSTTAIPTVEQRRQAVLLGTPVIAATSACTLGAGRNSETGTPVQPVWAIGAIHRTSLA